MGRETRTESLACYSGQRPAAAHMYLCEGHAAACGWVQGAGNSLISLVVQGKGGPQEAKASGQGTYPNNHTIAHLQDHLR